MSALNNANQQIRAARAQQSERADARRREQRPIRAIDRLLASLEELHLEGRKRVPEAFDDQLEELNELLPTELRRSLRSRITIAHLMDDLYEIQGVLLVRAGGGRLPADARDDGEQGWSRAS